MSNFRFSLIALLLFSFSTLSTAQTTAEKTEEILQRENKLIEQLQNDAESLKLPENRAYAFAKIGGSLCNTDEKGAIQAFQKSIGDLIAAQQEAEKVRKTPYNFEALVYGQQPRFTILEAIAACNPEIAIDALYKSRPTKILQMLAQSQGSKVLSNRNYYLTAEIQNEQRYITLAAEKNPERAMNLLRESLKNGVTYETLGLLQKIYTKDPKTADKLAEEVSQKLLGENLSVSNYQPAYTIQYFVQEFGREKNPEQKSLQISEVTLRSLVDKLSAFWVENANYSYNTNEESLRIVEKYFPARVAKLKQKNVQPENQEYVNYNKLMQDDVSPEEMMKQAENFQSYRNSIYSSAAQKMGQNGNVSQAINIINSNFSEEEAEQQLSNLYYNLAFQESSKENFEAANNYINQIPQTQNRFSALIQLTRNVYQKNKEENKEWAISITGQAQNLIETDEITQQEITNLIEIANIYAEIEPSQAFRTLESIVPTLNEFVRAYSVVSQFRNEQMQRNGEFFIINNGGMMGAYNLGNVIQILKDKDFDRLIQLVNSFERSEIRISMKLDLIRNFSSLPTGTRFSNSSIKMGFSGVGMNQIRRTK